MNIFVAWPIWVACPSAPSSAALPEVSAGTAVKIVASVVAVAGAVGALFYFSASPGMEYYKYVDEVTSKSDQLRDKQLKVHGYVVDGSILPTPFGRNPSHTIAALAERSAAQIS